MAKTSMTNEQRRTLVREFVANSNAAVAKATAQFPMFSSLLQERLQKHSLNYSFRKTLQDCT